MAADPVRLKTADTGGEGRRKEGRPSSTRQQVFRGRCRRPGPIIALILFPGSRHAVGSRHPYEQVLFGATLSLFLCI